jgi:hypothetical protein
LENISSINSPILRGSVDKKGLVNTGDDIGTSVATKEKKSTHLCLLCLEDSATASTYLKKRHEDHPEFQDVLKKEAASFNEKVSLATSSISARLGMVVSSNGVYFEQCSEK